MYVNLMVGDGPDAASIVATWRFATGASGPVDPTGTPLDFPSTAGTFFFREAPEANWTTTPTITTTVDLTWTVDAACQYGTQVKPGMPLVAIVDQALLQTALALIPGEWLGVLLGIFIGNAVDVSVMCGSVPKEPLDIAVDLLINPGKGAFDVLQRVLWPYFCECTPGATTPTPPPPYSPVQPPGWPPTPTYPCDPATPCVDLVDIRRKLDEVLRLVGEEYGLVTLLQRYQLPFASVPGSPHLGLQGKGSFAVQSLLGLRIHVTAHPPGHVDLEGTPPYVWDQGWVSILTGEGLIDERRVSFSQMDWMPRLMEAAIVVGYDFKPGTVVDITELHAEP
jgi:hypothetical protein